MEPPVSKNPSVIEFSPGIREKAYFKDPYEGQLNSLDLLNQGQRLPENGLKQLWHAVDLVEYQKPENRGKLDGQRGHLQNLLAENDAKRLLESADPVKPTLMYKNHEIPKHHTLELMRQEHETFRNTDRWMNNQEISKAKETLWPKTSLIVSP